MERILDFTSMNKNIGFHRKIQCVLNTQDHSFVFGIGHEKDIDKNVFPHI